jgi:hypothetical protein
MKILTWIFLIILLSSCSNSNDANKALTAMGFTDIQTTGYKWFACSDDDWYHTGFTATNPQGMQVSGVVCSGFFFKNSTVRF